MEIKKILAIVLACCTFISSFSTNFILESLIIDQNLSKSICKITNDVTNSKSDTHDILIGDFGGQNGSLIVNDIIHCIDDGKAVVATDLRRIIKNEVLRKASVIILKLNRVDKVSS